MKKTKQNTKIKRQHTMAAWPRDKAHGFTGGRPRTVQGTSMRSALGKRQYHVITSSTALVLEGGRAKGLREAQVNRWVNSSGP